MLNMAGRMVLAKSSMESMHIMSYIQIPERITKIIDKVIRDFVWGNANEKRKMHQVKYATITCSKDQRGLGLQKEATKNRATLAGLAWRIIEHPSKLWARILLNKFRSNPIISPTGRVAFRTWRNIQLGWKDTSIASK